MNTHKNNPTLTPTVFHILLALTDKERHGYEIIKQIEKDTEGSVKLLTGTLYLALKRLVELGHIEEVEQHVHVVADGGDQRRKYYRLTGKGQGALEKEIAVYRQRLAIVTKKNSEGLYGQAQPAN